jgi:A/G-specific adenine glycosylase
VIVDITEFQEIVWDKSRLLFRSMPWRTDTRPYYVMVSEIMLQQTQVDRVIPKFEAFINRFPTVEILSKATLAEVLQMWSGLGYNRRAKFLHEAAIKIMTEFDGVFPETYKELITLPGVGVNTAGALLAYSFNKPAVFIETNIRTVYFYHFFPGQDTVSDGELQSLVEATVDIEHPREWYWAIMDYGSNLKKQRIGQNSKSSHYTKQSPLKGSVREVRGAILKALISKESTERELVQQLKADERFNPALASLLKDGLVTTTQGVISLKR